ncbi:MAG TPA: aminoacyl-tRNA hydrolase [Acidobacteriota bacterium]|nr:aminoacyl-tRNA hydrolase [Acidobacteriota bacterium]
MEGGAPTVVVGLGNPGDGYANNRHNAGFLVVDALAREAGRRTWSRECLASTCMVELEGRVLMLVKPLTFMNKSGDTVRQLRLKYGTSPQDLLVVLDDLSLPLGRIRIRERGSAGGHHGLESVLEAMESTEILRLRLGIGEEQMPPEKAEFVLGDFSSGRQPEVNEMITRACDAVKMVVRDGVARAMAVYNA